MNKSRANGTKHRFGRKRGTRVLFLLHAATCIYTRVNGKIAKWKVILHYLMDGFRGYMGMGKNKLTQTKIYFAVLHAVYIFII